MQHANALDNAKASAPPDPELELIEDIAQFEHDPLGFVEFAFPWGTGELADHDGPMEWQRQVLEQIRDGLTPDHALRLAIASGHGIGKSALVSWIILWAMSTRVDTIGVVTANTGDQLKLKTWVQLAKWHRLCITEHWFAVQAKAIFAVDPEHEKTWRIDAVTWNETRTEAFAGLHNEGKRILLLYDEASGIPDVIWDVSTGALTDKNTEILWTAFGNPTRNTGRFRECFAGGRFHHRWNPQQIDSRNVPITNKEEIAEWVTDYGEDSDFVRVRVRGVFPRSGSLQFISADLVDAAASPHRDPPVTIYDPLIMGVDVQRFGDDKSVIRFRRGRDARTIAPLKFRNLDTMQLAAKVAELNALHRPDAIFIDGGGVGAGVVDRCRYLKLPITEVQFGASPDRDQIGQSGAIIYANKRAEMYGTMKEWLSGGMIDDDPELRAELPSIEYGYMMREGRDALVLEKKEHMKKRGLASPDDADALALTFAYPVGPSDHSHQFNRRQGIETEYDPFARSRT
jgi:hypothetical protein